MRIKAEPSQAATVPGEAADAFTADCVDLLVERVFYACHDWIVDGREPELDQGLVARRTRHRLAGMVRVLRGEIERRGLRPRQLSAWLGWPPGRLEEVFENPRELTTEELDPLVSALRLPIEKLFENDNRIPTKGDDDMPEWRELAARLEARLLDHGVDYNLKRMTVCIKRGTRLPPEIIEQTKKVLGVLREIAELDPEPEVVPLDDAALRKVWQEGGRVEVVEPGAWPPMHEDRPSWKLSEAEYHYLLPKPDPPPVSSFIHHFRLFLLLVNDGDLNV